MGNWGTWCFCIPASHLRCLGQTPAQATKDMGFYCLVINLLIWKLLPLLCV